MQETTTITITLTTAEKQRLTDLADQLGLTLEDLVHLSLESLLAQPQPTFDDAAAYVLRKNAELYKRLA